MKNKQKEWHHATKHLKKKKNFQLLAIPIRSIPLHLKSFWRIELVFKGSGRN